MAQNSREHISMQNPLRQEYIEYAATFNRMLETGAIVEEDEKFYEKTPTGSVPVIKLTYTEWLLELYISRHKY